MGPRLPLWTPWCRQNGRNQTHPTVQRTTKPTICKMRQKHTNKHRIIPQKKRHNDRPTQRPPPHHSQRTPHNHSRIRRPTQHLPIPQKPPLPTKHLQRRTRRPHQNNPSLNYPLPQIQELLPPRSHEQIPMETRNLRLLRQHTTRKDTETKSRTNIHQNRRRSNKLDRSKNPQTRRPTYRHKNPSLRLPTIRQPNPRNRSAGLAKRETSLLERRHPNSIPPPPSTTILHDSKTQNPPKNTKPHTHKPSPIPTLLQNVQNNGYRTPLPSPPQPTPQATTAGQLDKSHNQKLRTKRLRLRNNTTLRRPRSDCRGRKRNRMEQFHAMNKYWWKCTGCGTILHTSEEVKSHKCEKRMLKTK